MSKKVKIVCHTCNGNGTVVEEEYKTGKKILVKCPECNGEGWVWAELPE